VAAALMGQFHSPRRAFEIAYAAIEQRGVVQECEPVLNWLVASRTTGTNQIPFTVSPAFERPIPDSELYAAALAIVDQELPGLNHTPAPAAIALPTANSDMASLAQSVIAMSNAALSSRPTTRSVRSPRSHFGAALDQVLFLTLSDSEHHLPAVFWDVSDVTRTQHIGVIANRLTTKASRMQMSLPPPWSRSLSQKLSLVIIFPVQTART
jgi:hypothetical protein